MFYDEQQITEMRHERKCLISISVMELLSHFIDRNENCEHFNKVYTEVMRPILMPELVKKEADEAGLTATKYCVQRLKKIGVKGKLISQIKLL